MSLLDVEERTRDVSPAVRAEAKQAVESIVAAALQSGGTGSTPESANKALRAMQSALCARGYRQPLRTDAWPDTIGQAFGTDPGKQPIDTDNCAMRAERSTVGPTRFIVDCDMGAQLLVSAGQMLGWDIRVVNIPKHTFVRWHLRNGTAINWDWTAGASYPDSHYEYRFSERSKTIGAYGRSLTLTEAKGYYLSLIGSNAKDPLQGRQSVTEAIKLNPLDPVIQNNYAWFFASHPSLGEPPADALGFALASLAWRPDDPNIIETVGCMYAANGERDIALALVQKAVTSGGAESYRHHLKQIELNGKCDGN